MKKIKLTQGKYALVDNEDFEYLNQWKWQYAQNKKTGYAIRTNIENGKRTTIRMARQILLFPKLQVDHKDRNGLNNQRKNLRIATSSDNSCNRSKRIDNKSGYPGIHKDKSGKYIVVITKNHKYHYIGYFPTLKKAILERIRYSILYHGEFANL